MFEKIQFLSKPYLFFKRVFSNEVAAFIACQFALESNFGQSHLARDHFNFCGMKSPITRPTFNLNPAKAFCSFGSEEECFMDYLCWCCFTRLPIGAQQYLCNFKNHLKVKQYCSDPDYIPSIQKLYDQYSDTLFLTFQN